MKSVTTIIPTTCEKSRSELILRAINSVLDQEGVKLEVIIVVNGKKYDTALLDSIKNNHQLKVIYIPKGNVSFARSEGIKYVTSDYFGFLDDDDEYLQHSLSTRANEMEREPGIDVIVTNGYIHEDADTLLVDNHIENKIKQDLALSFFERNWFASPASLFRKNTVAESIFEFDFKYFEWTYLFFRLITEQKKIKYSDSITYRKYENNSLSISKSLDYRLALPDFLLELYKLPLATNIKDRIRKKYQMSLNLTSNYYLDNNKRKQAIMFHVKCLLNGGWQYLPYTRKLFF